MCVPMRAGVVVNSSKDSQSRITGRLGPQGARARAARAGGVTGSRSAHKVVNYSWRRTACI